MAVAEKAITHDVVDTPKLDAGGVATHDSGDEHDADLEPFTHAETRKIVHKIDRRLLPICGLMVAVSLLDRGNLSNAYIAG